MRFDDGSADQVDWLRDASQPRPQPLRIGCGGASSRSFDRFASAGMNSGALGRPTQGQHRVSEAWEAGVDEASAGDETCWSTRLVLVMEASGFDMQS
jgi:hypothetical protein